MNTAEFLKRRAVLAPDAVAVYRDDAVYASYGVLHARALRQGGWLKSRFGETSHTNIAIVADNCPEYIEAFFAVWSAGMTVVPINARLHPNEIAYILSDSRAAACICDAGHGEEINALDASVFPDHPPVVMEFKELAKAGKSTALDKPLAREGDDLAWLFYTSGTTGKPKGVMLSHENLRQMALNFFANVEHTRPDYSLLHFAPLSHGSGMYLIPYVMAGASNIVPVAHKFRSGECIPLINSQEHVSAFMAPTMINRIVAMSDIGALRTDRLQTIVFGGAPMLAEDLRRAWPALGGRLAQIYGQGECPMTITCLSRSELAQAISANDTQIMQSAGRAFDGVDVTTEVQAPEGGAHTLVSEILVKGPVVMRGYWQNPEATREQMERGWLKTGDMGLIDERGYLTIKDRCRDLIISGGMNIYPREIEEVLMQHADVAEVTVVGCRNREWGEIPVAFVVARKGVEGSAAVLDEFCLDRMARFKRPREYRFVAELPRNNYGKIMKRDLQALLESDSEHAAKGSVVPDD